MPSLEKKMKLSTSTAISVDCKLMLWRFQSEAAADMHNNYYYNNNNNNNNNSGGGSYLLQTIWHFVTLFSNFVEIAPPNVNLAHYLYAIVYVNVN